MKRRALVVGINRYRYLKQHLECAASDAEAIARLLRKCGHFEVKVLPETYQDGAIRVAENNGFVDEDTLRSEISKLFNPGDDYPETALLFFAGHGLHQSLPLNEFKGYLAPGDVNPSKGKWGIPFDWLRDILIQSPVPNQIVWLDCCHSGDFTNLIFDQANAENQGRTNVNRSFIAACRKFEAAQEFEDHGLLTSLLLRGLNPDQDPRGKWINSKNLDAFINDELRNDPKLSTFRQRFRTNSPGEPIIFWQTLGAITPSLVDENSGGAVSASRAPAKEKMVVGIETMQAVPVWVGRDKLLRQLSAKLLIPNTETVNNNLPKVLVLVGQGGIGKSSLAVKLLEAVGVNLPTATLVNSSDYNRIICFRAEAGNSFDEVAKAILDGLGIEADAKAEANQKIRQILAGLTQERCLLLLDNLEVILHPASHPQSGRAITPDWGKLLHALAVNNHRSQVILTSREIPADLGDGQSAKVVFDSVLVHIETLLGVDVAAGIEILRQRQLRDSEEDLRWITERVGGHAFLLTQLANLGKDKPGYLRQHPELVTENAEPILQAQLARQGKKARDLLRRMCVLRVGINIRGLTFLRLYNDGQKDFWDLSVSNLFRTPVCKQPHELTVGEINQTKLIIERLVESSLVQSRYDETGEYLYSLHRLIVEFLQGTYQADIPHLLKSVYAFYQAGKQVKDPQNLEDLRPILEAQYFAFQLGNYQEAYSLLTANIGQYLTYWGNWNLLKDLYDQILPYVKDSADRRYCLISIGVIHRNWGNWDEAEKYFRDALASAQKENSKSGMASSWELLGYIESCRGNWDEAEALYRQSLEVRTQLGDRAGMATSWGQLGDIERDRGKWDEAEALYRQSLEVMTQLRDRAGMAAIWGVLGDIERDRGKWDGAQALYRQSLEVRTQLRDQSGMAALIGCLGENELGRGNLDAAEKLLREALAKMEELGMTWHIAETNYDLAQLERRRGNTEIAQQHYDTAHQIFVQLGAAKQLERIEREWALSDEIKD
jgi:tetratricopeptide (TPR) repeat protein